MRLPLITWVLPSLVNYVFASAAEPSQPAAYLFDTHSQQTLDTDSSLIDSVHPTTAFLIFAQRLSLSRFYNVGELGHDEERQIELLGGPPSTIFGDDTAETRSKVFVTIEGSKGVYNDLFQGLDLSAYFHMTGMPDEGAVDEILAGFKSKAKHMETVHEKRPYQHITGLERFPWHHGNDLLLTPGRTIIHIKSLAVGSSAYPSNPIF
jgi:hypothetical protein